MRDFPPNHYTFMRDFPPNRYTFMRNFPPYHYIFMRNFSPFHYIFMRDFSHKDAVKATDTKKRLHVPEGSCNRFLYIVLLLLSEQAHFYFVRLILLFTFTASAKAAQQIAKINPKIIIILILSLIFNCYPYLCFSVFPICTSFHNRALRQ